LKSCNDVDAFFIEATSDTVKPPSMRLKWVSGAFRRQWMLPVSVAPETHCSNYRQLL
jgi:hypothetical protein